MNALMKPAAIILAVLLTLAQIHVPMSPVAARPVPALVLVLAVELLAITTLLAAIAWTTRIGPYMERRFA